MIQTLTRKDYCEYCGWYNGETTCRRVINVVDSNITCWTSKEKVEQIKQELYITNKSW